MPKKPSLDATHSVAVEGNPLTCVATVNIDDHQTLKEPPQMSESMAVTEQKFSKSPCCPLPPATRAAAAKFRGLVDKKDVETLSAGDIVSEYGVLVETNATNDRKLSQLADKQSMFEALKQLTISRDHGLASRPFEIGPQLSAVLWIEPGVYTAEDLAQNCIALLPHDGDSNVHGTRDKARVITFFKMFGRLLKPTFAESLNESFGRMLSLGRLAEHVEELQSDRQSQPDSVDRDKDLVIKDVEEIAGKKISPDEHIRAIEQLTVTPDERFPTVGFDIEKCADDAREVKPPIPF
jgi:hypothetical protein